MKVNYLWRIYIYWFYVGYLWIGKLKWVFRDRKLIDVLGREGVDKEMNLYIDIFFYEII